MKIKQKAPGRFHRKGISLLELADMFPNEQSAVKWFEETRWPHGRACPHCGTLSTSETPNRRPMPYWCKDCRKYFSVRTGTALECSRLPLRKWVFAVYIYVTNLKSVSSMKLHRDLRVTQKTAWFMLHRLREAWDDSGIEPFAGPVEVDESYFGGKRRHQSKSKQEELKGTRGTAGKIAVVGIRDRATNKIRAMVVEKTDAKTLRGFIEDHTIPTAKVYTDDSPVYYTIPFDHESVTHSVGEYVREWPTSMEWRASGRPETGLQRHLPPIERQAFEPIRSRVRSSPQHP